MPNYFQTNNFNEIEKNLNILPYFYKNLGSIHQLCRQSLSKNELSAPKSRKYGLKVILRKLIQTSSFFYYFQPILDDVGT